jgi:nitrate reductase NapAB chaperone NapD
MKIKRYSTLLVFLCLFSFFAKAQETGMPKNVKKTFFYSFENVNSPSQIETLKQNVAFLKGVSEVKSEYKPETAMGQIIVVVIEKQRTLEGDVLFDIRGLKNAIIQNQLTPLELTQEESIIEN